MSNKYNLFDIIFLRDLVEKLVSNVIQNEIPIKKFFSSKLCQTLGGSDATVF